MNVKQLLLMSLALSFAPAANAYPGTVQKEYDRESESSAAIFIGPSLGINAPASDLNSLGGSFALLFRLPATQLSIGFETGYWVYKHTDTEMHVSNGLSTVVSEQELTARTIPLLLSTQYEFASSGFVPYLGLATGIGIVSATDGIESASETRFMAVAKPGFRISSFFVEPKVGIIGESLAFLPTVGVALRF